MRLVPALVVAVLGLATLGPTAPALAAPPPNDAFAAAQQLPSSTPLNVPTNSLGGTLEPGEPDYEYWGARGDSSIWFSWTAPRKSRFRIANCSKTAETVMRVYTGSSLGTLKPAPESTAGRDYDQHNCAFGDFGAAYLIAATPGTTYHIVIVESYLQSGGPLQLTIDDIPVPLYDSGISQKQSRKSVKSGRTVTYTATLTNLGDLPVERIWVQLVSSAGGLSRPARKVRYTSITTTRGTCKRQTFFAVHKGAMCAIGRLEPGQTAVVTAKVKLRQSISHWAFLDYQPGTGQPEPDERTKNDESRVRTSVHR